MKTAGIIGCLPKYNLITIIQGGDTFMPCKKKTSLMVILVFLITLFTPAMLYADTVDVKAEAYVLMDADSGKVLLAANEHKRLAPASMTKLMTLILAVEDLQNGKVGLKDKVVPVKRPGKWEVRRFTWHQVKR